MNYNETLNWMFSKLPMYQRKGKTAFKKDLTNSIAFAEALNHPEKKFKSIHIAGTNGKGSTAHMLASILQEGGYKVGLYTSPHLKDFTERIKINGKPIRKNCVINFIKRNRAFLENQQLSFFEMTVGLAFEHFAKKKVDFAIIETGLGGRLDSTNIIKPLVSVITNIAIDHTQFLGNTLPKIAKEKAGIIKEKTPVVIGEKQEEVLSVFTDVAKKKNAAIFFASDLVTKEYKTDLKGSYQKKNIKSAVQTIKVLQQQGLIQINDAIIENGLQKVVRNTNLLGRWHILGNNPKIICDTAHNTAGLKYIIHQLADEKFTKLHIVFGVVNDKDLDSILPLLPNNARYYFCKPNIPRGMDPILLKNKAASYNLSGNIYQSVSKALLQAKKRAKQTDLIFVGGSTFVVAEVI